MVMGGVFAFFGGLVVHYVHSGELGWSYLFVKPMQLEALVTAIFSVCGAASGIVGALLVGFVLESQDQVGLQKSVGA